MKKSAKHLYLPALTGRKRQLGRWKSYPKLKRRCLQPCRTGSTAKYLSDEDLTISGDGSTDTGSRITFLQDVLTVADFSAIHDLYGVVSDVNDIGVVPVSRVDLYALLLVAFIPTIPVVIGSVPLDVVARAALKMLF